MARIGFVGLGVMGYPMAGHLVRAGHEVTVFNRTQARAEAWAAAFGGTCVATPREVGAACDMVMLCVGNDSDVRSGQLEDWAAIWA
jgi:3-hydroxyisobutyrate dehydrogenase